MNDQQARLRLALYAIDAERARRAQVASKWLVAAAIVFVVLAALMVAL